MQKLILIKYGELWLKGDYVRRRFERILRENIKKHLRRSESDTAFHRSERRMHFESSPCINAEIKTSNGRTYIFYSGKFDSKFLKRTFGIVGFAPAIECNKDIEEIRNAAGKFVSKKKTFVIRARRTDKSFPLRSKDIAREVGMHLESLGYTADIRNAKHVISIEIRDNAYIYASGQAGPGGLPLGSGGCAAAMLRDNDDLAAAWLVMKRGVECIFIKPKKQLLKSIGRWSIGRKARTVKSIKEASKSAKTLVDCREKTNMKGSFVVLNPLAGFSEDEKKELIRKIKRKQIS